VGLIVLIACVQQGRRDIARGCDPALQQDCAQLVDQTGSVCDQTLTRAMQRLHFELLLAFQLDKLHGWARHGFGDSASRPSFFRALT
jgi:hypothetical protein